jgi:hypothetical protein
MNAFNTKGRVNTSALLSGLLACTLSTIATASYASDAMKASANEITLEQLISQGVSSKTVLSPQPRNASAKSAQTVIDIMGVFQPSYLTLIGEQVAHERLASFVASANASFEQSDITITLNLVNAQVLQNLPDSMDYNSVRDDAGTVLIEGATTRVINILFDEFSNSEGPYEEYNVYRAYGADLVVYVRDYREFGNSGNTLGTGSQLGEFSTILDRFDGSDSVNKDRFLDVFSHEIGHNMGADHEEANSADSSASDARAYTCNGGKHTIMWSAGGSGEDVSAFSNPTLQLGGEFCGELGTADNARVINSNATLAASRRDAPQSAGDIAFSDTTYTVEEDAGTVTVYLIRTGSLSGTSTVEVALVGGSAKVGADSLTYSQRATFTTGQSEASVVFDVIADADKEGDEYFDVALRYPLAATVSTTAAKLVILDSYEGVIGDIDVTVSTEVTEGSDATVTLTRVNGIDGELVVNVVTSDGTATDGSDYTAVSQDVVFADGETEKTLTLSTTNDTTTESAETFSVNVSSAQGITITNAASTITITDNDVAPAPTPTPTPTPNAGGSSSGGGSLGSLLLMAAMCLFTKRKR